MAPACRCCGIAEARGEAASSSSGTARRPCGSIGGRERPVGAASTTATRGRWPADGARGSASAASCRRGRIVPASSSRLFDARRHAAVHVQVQEEHARAPRMIALRSHCDHAEGRRQLEVDIALDAVGRFFTRSPAAARRRRRAARFRPWRACAGDGRRRWPITPTRRRHRQARQPDQCGELRKAAKRLTHEIKHAWTASGAVLSNGAPPARRYCAPCNAPSRPDALVSRWRGAGLRPVGLEPACRAGVAWRRWRRRIPHDYPGRPRLARRTSPWLVYRGAMCQHRRARHP